MARLPKPGGDKGAWGVILNDYLSQSHKPNGTLRDDVVGTDQIQDNAVTATEIAPGAVSKTDVGLGNVDNTSDADKPISTATQAALDDKQPLDGDLTDIAGLSPTNNDILQRKSGEWTNRTPAEFKADLSLTKSDVDLGNVDNVQQQPLDADLTAIAGLDSSTSGTIASDGSGWEKKTYSQFKSSLNLVKTDVGLGNVDNTSDADKPISTATQAALDDKQPLDGDLTSIAALSTTSYGRDLLTLADQAALKSAVGTASETAAGVVELATTAETTTGTDTTRATTPAGVKAVADTKQPLDATLTALAGVTTAADKMIYATGSDTFTTADLSSFSRTLLDDTTAATARTTLDVPKVASGTSSQSVAANSKTCTISGYTLKTGDFIALTLTNGNTATSPTLNVNGSGAVPIQQTSPSPPDFDAASGAIWFLYYTGSVYILLNNGDPVDALRANKLVTGMDNFSREFINGDTTVVSQRLNLTYFTCEKIFTATQMRTVTGTIAAGATPTTCKMGLYQVNADNTLTLLAKTANNTSLWSAPNTVYTEVFESGGSVAMTRNQRYAFAILIDTAAATPTFQGQAWANGNIGTYTPRLVGEFSGQTDIPSSLAAATGTASSRPWGVVLP